MGSLYLMPLFVTKLIFPEKKANGAQSIPFSTMAVGYITWGNQNTRKIHRPLSNHWLYLSKFPMTAYFGIRPQMIVSHVMHRAINNWSHPVVCDCKWPLTRDIESPMTSHSSDNRRYIRLFLKPFLYFNILSIIWQLLLSVKWRHLFSSIVTTRPFSLPCK